MTIVNDATSWRVTLELSLTLQESSIMLLENIFSTGITYDDYNMFIEETPGVKLTDLLKCKWRQKDFIRSSPLKKWPV